MTKLHFDLVVLDVFCNIVKKQPMNREAIELYWTQRSDRGDFNHAHFQKVVEFRRLNEVNGKMEEVVHRPEQIDMRGY